MSGTKNLGHNYIIDLVNFFVKPWPNKYENGLFKSKEVIYISYLLLYMFHDICDKCQILLFTH